MTNIFPNFPIVPKKHKANLRAIIEQTKEELRKNKHPFLLSSLYSFFYKSQSYKVFDSFEPVNKSFTSAEELPAQDSFTQRKTPENSRKDSLVVESTKKTIDLEGLQQRQALQLMKELEEFTKVVFQQKGQEFKATVNRIMTFSSLL